MSPNDFIAGFKSSTMMNITFFFSVCEKEKEVISINNKTFERECFNLIWFYKLKCVNNIIGIYLY